MIHVEFRDFQDMLSFARQLLGQVEGEKVEKPVQSAVAPAAPAVPVQSAPVPPGCTRSNTNAGSSVSTSSPDRTHSDTCADNNGDIYTG